MRWSDAATEEIAGLNPRLFEKHGWAPAVSRTGDHVDLFASFRIGSSRAGHVLRLRYLEDWQAAGRRETFVNPADLAQEGGEWWPRGVAGVNPDHSPPAICLHGFWGFHSVLHPGGAPAERPLSAMLRDLQTQFSRA